jgi:glycosyltransferase involved in cell wall biosynthesis
MGEAVERGPFVSFSAIGAAKTMRLLITTQALDLDDPVLGFFHRWVEEFAKHCEQVTVICLRRGRHELPPNVRVFALGGKGRISRAYRLLRGAYKFSGNYDAVFAHMNPEYIVVAGWLWRLMRKRAALWYTHKSVDLKLRIAVLFAGVIFTASKESFRLRSGKVRVMGHGIDTDFFFPDPGIARGGHFLSVGRLMPTKRHDLAIRAAAEAGVPLRIAGDGPERAALEALAGKLGVAAAFLGGVSQQELRDEYRRAALLIHRSETGSLDKVVLEALACGCPISTSDPALKHMEPEGPGYVRQNHSLESLIPRILEGLSHGSY